MPLQFTALWFANGPTQLYKPPTRCPQLFLQGLLIKSTGPQISRLELRLNMGLKALPLSTSQNGFLCNTRVAPGLSRYNCSRKYNFVLLLAKKDDTSEEPKRRKQSLFSSVTEALDFSQVRSVKDAELLEEAKEATQSGGRMSREQYGALRRKIGGTYKDFFKSYIEVDGQYVEEGWVDKTCKICKKDTGGEPRQVDKFGRYVHVGCLENSKSGNIFTKLFSR